jgi:RNA-directed DNA polymerase
MRFLYDGKVATIEKNGNFKLFPEKSVSVKEDLVEQNARTFLTNDYNKFLATIAEQTKNKIEKVFYVIRSEDHFLLAVKEGDGDTIVKSLYKPENQHMVDLMGKLIKINNGEGRALIANVFNDFNFLTARSILKVIFQANYLKSQNKPLYREFKIKSKNGKVRNIVAPNEDLKKELQSLNSVFQYIFDKVNIDFQIAYKKGKNILDNAEIHKDQKFVYNVDLKDFYPSCKKELVQKQVNFFFKNSFNGDVVEEEFLDIVLHNDALFIGSPISGTLANIIISKAANYIKNIAAKFDMNFSVYADDMTFSSDRYIDRKVVEGMFNAAFTKYDLDTYFKLNETKFHGMSNNRRRITGVSINHEDEATVSRTYYRDLRVKIHKLSIGEFDNINLQKLRGKIAFATMVDQSGKILRLLEKFETTVFEHKLLSKEKFESLKNKKGQI